MNSFIYLYDNFLIYYPNIFFPALIIICILLIILAFKITRLIVKEGIRSFGKIRVHPIRISNFPLIFALRFLEKISKILEYLQIKIEIILKKIRREILIEE